MARHSSVKYYESRKGYYTVHQGKVIRLADGEDDRRHGPLGGPVYQAAAKKFAEVITLGSLDSLGDTMTVRTLAELHARHLERERPASLAGFLSCMRDADRLFGSVEIRHLKPHQVNGWLASHDEWNPSTKRAYLDRLGGMFNWGVLEGRISMNPIRGKIKKPQALSRGRDCLIPDALADLLLREASPAFRLFLRAMRETGCRPGELSHAKATHYRADLGAVVHRWDVKDGEWCWKNAKKTKRDRAIYFPEGLRQLVEESVKKGGHIFRTKNGNWFRPDRIAGSWRKLLRRKRVRAWLLEHKIDADKIVPYGFRHSYITSWLQSGRSSAIVAQLCGTSTLMIARTYGHLDADLEGMRKQALGFVGE